MAWRRPNPAIIALAVLMALVAVILFEAGSGLNFYRDEWLFIQLRREWTVDDVVAPHAEHLHLVAALLFKVLFVTAGLGEYWPYLALVVAAHLLTAGLTFAYARRRLEEGPALAAATLALFLGAGFENLLWGIQVGYVVPVAAAIGMFLGFDRGDRRGDIVASALIGVGLASQAVGLALIVPACIEILARPRRWRRIWVVAAPFALYLLWWINYRLGGPVVQNFDLSSNLAASPSFVVRSAAAGVGGLTGVEPQRYGLLAASGVLLLAVVLVARRRASHEELVRLRVASLAALTLSFLLALALGRAGSTYPPFTSRYVYVTAVFMLLLGVELARGVRLDRRWLAVLGLLVALSAWGNYGLFRDGLHQFERSADDLMPKVAALEIAGPSIRPDFRVKEGIFPWVVAFTYFPAVRDFGSPADSPAELLRRAPPERRAADETLVQALEIRPQPARGVRVGGPPPRALTPGVRRRGSCLLHDGDGPASIELTAPAAGILVRARGRSRALVQVRRFADEYRRTPVAAVSGAAAVRLPTGESIVPWKVRVSGGERVRVCTLVAS